MIERYNLVVQELTDKEKRYVHAKSLLNFITHLEKLEGISYLESKALIEKYLNEIELNSIDANLAIDLYQHYVHPLGKLYTKLGFKKQIILRYQLILVILLDLAISFLFFHFPLPIFTVITILNYFFIRKQESSKRYAMFY